MNRKVPCFYRYAYLYSLAAILICASAVLGTATKPATAGTLALSEKLTNSSLKQSMKSRRTDRLKQRLVAGRKLSLTRKLASISTTKQNAVHGISTPKLPTKKLVQKLKANRTSTVSTEVLSLVERIRGEVDAQKNTSLTTTQGDKNNNIKATIQAIDSTEIVQKLKHDVGSYSRREYPINNSQRNWHQEQLSLTSSPDDLIAKIKSQSTPEIIISQADSSGVVGDTFGEINKLRQQLLIEPIDPIIVRTKLPIASPSSTAGTPTGYGVGSRQAYIGGGLSFPLDSDRDRTDGSFSFGFGEGDPINSLGVEFNFNITSVGSGSTFDFGDSGTIGFKLHRVLSRSTAVAFGWSNPIRWGDSDRSRPTLYGVITKAIPLQPNNPNHKFPLTVSVGVGSGAFRSKGALEDGTDTPNLFGSVGLQVIPQASVIGSWTGNRLNLGVSAVPFKSLPLVINAIYTDVTDNLNIGSGLSVVTGFGLRF